MLHRRERISTIDIWIRRKALEWGTSLASLYDISDDYRWKHGVSISLYFGYAVGGEFIKKIYPVSANGALGYTQLNYRF